MHSKDELGETLGYIEDEFLSELTRPQPCNDHDIIDGHLYLAVHKIPDIEMPKQFNYHAYRVRVEEIDRTQKRALCFYIDDGYSEWLEYKTNLFHLNRNLLKYSAEAIHFSLFNVEDFEVNSYACEEIRRQLLSNKCFVATVKSTQTQFEKQLETLDSDALIPVILFDTSTDDDRNVNKDILEKILKRMEPPQLNPRNTNIVDITHVCENCDVYCRLRESKEMQLIEQILDRIIKTIDIGAYRIDPQQSMKNDGKMKLHLIHDKISERFYRAIILPTESKQPQPMCRCVDYGFVKCVPFDDIYNLERLSLALSSYPHQAILVQLNGIDGSLEYTADSIQRIRERLVCDKPIYLDVVVQSEWPIVEAWKTKDGIRYLVNGLIQRTLKV